jgi:hypothetical protein
MTKMPKWKAKLLAMTRDEVWAHPDAERIFEVLNLDRATGSPPLSREEATAAVRERIAMNAKLRRQLERWKAGKPSTDVEG